MYTSQACLNIFCKVKSTVNKGQCLVILLSRDYVELPWDYCEAFSHLIQDLERRKEKRVDRASTLGSDMAPTRQYFSCKPQIV